ncbi:hypothetical protein [Ruminococcus sp. NK3A76]|uniref:hypothetical protein n=1 Tax=Ruminococcus sp. NK3A76 TaxID=877411 RepID=UPI00048F71CA|nr:hypothetical protein [Ruminococcus sp. NK3A76]
MPMTLFLYNKSDEDSFDSVFSWSPFTKQWWITGFNPDYVGNVDVNTLIMIGKIDMSQFTDENGNIIYETFKTTIQNEIRFRKYVDDLYFCDQFSTVWIMWGD